MAYLRTLVAGLLAGFAFTAHAGYAQLSPPSGWSPVSFQGSAGSFNFGTAAANSATFSNGTVRTNAALNVGGRAVTVPAALRFAANSPQFLAGRIGTALAIGGSAVLTGGLTVAAALLLPAAVQWWSSSPYEWEGGRWIKKEKILNGYWAGPHSGQFSSADAACKSSYPQSWVVLDGETKAYCMVTGGVLATVYRTGREEVVIKTVDYETEVRPALENLPLPSALPQAIPLEYPIEQPVVNPSPSLQPQPLFVPTGNPVSNPSYDPSSPASPENQPYWQPGVRVVPAPAPGAPWQVDLQPVNRPVASSDSSPSPVTEGEPNSGDKPSEEKPDLCEKHSDIVACQRLGDVQPEALASKTVPVSIQREDGFGPADGACPAPKEFVILGKQMAFRWDLICDFASGIRPLLVGFAYLSAALAFLGLSRKEV